MTNKKQKEKKIKDRERKVEEKLKKRRDALRKEKKIMDLQKRQEEEAQNLVQGKLRPIVNDYEKVSEIKENKNASALSQLQKNLEILKALEQEYDKEQQVRNSINETLESEGHLTMAEKMDALHKKALELAQSRKEEALSDSSQNLSVSENLE